MRRFAAAFVVTAFVLWIVPLGAVLSAPAEGKACGGKRAFHMCTMSKAPSKAPAGLSWTPGPAPSSPRSPASAGDEFIAPVFSVPSFGAAGSAENRNFPAYHAALREPLFRPPIFAPVF